MGFVVAMASVGWLVLSATARDRTYVQSGVFELKVASAGDSSLRSE